MGIHEPLLDFGRPRTLSFKNRAHGQIRHHCPEVPWVLLGTKTDLREDKDTLEKLQKEGLGPISTEDGQRLAQELLAVKYFECSALAHIEGLKTIFEETILAAVEHRSKAKKAKKHCRII
jgi:GTPase SAR1 family protein